MSVSRPHWRGIVDEYNQRLTLVTSVIVILFLDGCILSLPVSMQNRNERFDETEKAISVFTSEEAMRRWDC